MFITDFLVLSSFLTECESDKESTWLRNPEFDYLTLGIDLLLFSIIGAVIFICVMGLYFQLTEKK